MSIMDSTEAWVRKGPGLALAVVAAITLVIGAVVGTGVGFKFEQNRAKSDVRRLQKQVRASASPGVVTGTGALAQRIGRVTKAKPGSITITTKNVPSLEVETGTPTSIQKTAKGSIGNVVAGTRVLVTRAGDEVIVLSATSRMGRVVSAVTSKNFLVSGASGGPPVGVRISDVRGVSLLKPATSADIKVGVDLFVGGQAATKDLFNAAEVIVLPAHSRFAA